MLGVAGDLPYEFSVFGVCLHSVGYLLEEGELLASELDAFWGHLGLHVPVDDACGGSEEGLIFKVLHECGVVFV